MRRAAASAVVAAALLALPGCRLETPPEPEAPGTAGTGRVTPDEAAVADPGDITGADAGDSTGADASVEVLRVSSGLVLPVPGVAPADLVDTFTAARDNGRRHDAIDILAPRGTPVVAAAAGRVARLFTSERGGLTVYVIAPDADGGHVVYYYAHLDAYAPGLADGQDVAAGQPLGTVGDSGNAVPGNTHLHFAIWRVDDPGRFWDGPAVNPYPLLGGR